MLQKIFLKRLNKQFGIHNNEIYLSIVSLWEMQIKIQLGKLRLNQRLSETIEIQQRDNNINILPISIDHVCLLEQLPNHHRDPFDRMLIVQAQHEKLMFVTNDEKIRQYDISLLW